MTVLRLNRRQMLIQTAGAALVLVGCRRSFRGSGGSRVGVIYFAPEAGAELCMKGLFDGLAQEGYKKDRNLDVISSHAQGEISNIPMLCRIL
jgi:ABC-type uncharacterized transport system substrate-binding protein